MKLITWTLLGMLIVCQPVMAENENIIPAQELLKKNLAAVVEVLQKKDLSQETKKQDIVDIVSPMFDFALMAKLTLGRKYWPDLQAEQQEKFTQLFIRRLRATYLDSLTLYTDEKIFFEPPVEVKQKVHIPTYLLSKDKKITILYKFYESEKNWRIYDLEIQGVSLIRSYQSQFHQILQTETFEDLLAKMEKPAEK
jgi:phospholipid transport system substrate-binding protein